MSWSVTSTSGPHGRIPSCSSMVASPTTCRSGRRHARSRAHPPTVPPTACSSTCTRARGCPTPTAAKQALVSRADLVAHGARPFDVVRTTIRSLRTKSLLDDLQAIEAHNETVEQQLTDRDRLLRPLTRSTPAPTTETSAVIAPELDAERLVDLFASPWEHVAEHIPPVEFAPQAGGRNGEGLDRLTRRLAQELAATTLPRAADLPVLSRSSLPALGRGDPDHVPAHRMVPVRRRRRACRRRRRREEAAPLRPARRRGAHRRRAQRRDARADPRPSP